MTSPPSGRVTVDDGRPPGGTARTPGTKTPRKVQWATDDRTKPTEPSASTHALDEHGLDPNAFQTLTHALERHRSSTPQTTHFPLTLRTDFPTTTNSTNPSTPSPPSPTHSVPGENFIEPGERAGLPGTDDLEGYARRAAGRVVRSDESERGRSRTRGRGKRRNFFGGFRRSREAMTRERVDVEKDAESGGKAKGGGAVGPGVGVLSTLLTLYDHHHQEKEKEKRTGMTTRPAAALSSVPGVDEDIPERPRPSSAPPTHPEDSHCRHHHRHTSSSSSSTPLRSNTALSLVPSMPFRTPETRNAAGVFGSLIASTGNISGAAAPVSSQLAPDIEKPGYHLSRYSLSTEIPTDNSKTHKRKSKVTPPSRSGSTHVESRATSPSPDENANNNNNHTTPSSSSSVQDLWAHGHGHGLGNGKSHRWSGGFFNYAASTRSRSGATTPTTDGEEMDEKAWLMVQEDLHRKRRKRKKAEVYITRHVADIIQRQEFILKLTRAMMMFGGPSHRLQAQIQATARVLDLEISCMYLPDVVLISFDDAGTGTSSVKFIRQGSALDLGKLHDSYGLYWRVIHDELSVSEASIELDTLMRKQPLYNWWQLTIIGGLCSASICSVSFNGSFIDSLMCIPLGGMLVGIQLLSVRNELYSNVFEITVATLLSFVAAALASTHRFCYSAVASSSVVLILPGFIVLCGSLEISSRNIVSGAVRLCYALMYSLFLGFGLAIGAEVYEKAFSKTVVGPEDYYCRESHDPYGPWWQRTPPLKFAFLTVPMYSLFLSLRNQAPWNRKEMLILIVISCIGWVANHFTSLKFVSQNDISAAVGAFTVGLISNLYGRFVSGNAFVVMITGILFQLPSGLGHGGLLTFASQQSSGSDTSTSYLSGFQTALQLIGVATGLTVGLGVSLVVVHPIQSRRRAGGVFSL